MLIVCNGAYKSGSTWLFRIVKSMVPHEPLPAAYHAAGWEGTGIDPPKLGRFLRGENYHDHTYIIKGHFFERHHLFTGQPDVRLMLIRRDTRDVVVSAFHYERMKGFDTEENITDYYRRRGWKVARMVVRYNRLWEGRPNTHMSSYERLHTDFAAEVRDIGGFFNIRLSDADVERLREENSLESLKSKYDERSADGSRSFFRKGVIGDWREQLTADIAADIQRIETEQAAYPRGLDLLNLRIRHAYLALTGK